MLLELSTNRHRRGRSRLLVLLFGLIIGIALLARTRSQRSAINDHLSRIKVNIQAATNRIRQSIRPSRPYASNIATKQKCVTDFEYLIDEDLELVETMGEHERQANGLLVVNPEGAHPIYELMERAETRWAEKQRKASRTLGQAVKEYVRRYKRQPPLGFEHWWHYVRQNDVQLPDEYDQIYHDLEPFWGLDPLQLREALDEVAKLKDSYTLGKREWDAPITVLSDNLPPARKQDMLAQVAKPMMDLLKDVYKFIPPFQGAFSPHDNPELLVDHSWKSEALAAAANGTVLRYEDLPQTNAKGFALSCPPDSPLARDPPAIAQEPTPPSEKTFIYDIKAATNTCQNPQHLLLHGQFLRENSPPTPHRPLVPFFAHCKTTLHSDILVTPLYLTDRSVPDDWSWANKNNDKLMWRGTATGAWHSPKTNWRNAHRARLLNTTGTKNAQAGEGSLPDELELLYPTLSEDLSVGSPKKVSRKAINNDRMDIAFVGPTAGCHPETCEIMNKAFRYTEHVDHQVAKSYKYIFDIDGHGWSGRFHRLMSMNSAIFKATIYPEWFTDRIEPWLHYIPVQIDYSDLYDTFTFFGGSHKGHKGRDDLAEKIGAEGRDWTETFWRSEDMTAYMFRLYLEYARVMHPNRTEMNYGASRTAFTF